jgi:hypothetical protein
MKTFARCSREETSLPQKRKEEAESPLVARGISVVYVNNRKSFVVNSPAHIPTHFKTLYEAQRAREGILKVNSPFLMDDGRILMRLRKKPHRCTVKILDAEDSLLEEFLAVGREREGEQAAEVPLACFGRELGWSQASVDEERD